MDNKYYTPAIEDLFVGYECERDTKDGWKKFVYGDNGSPYVWIDEIRTPFLTKEQIEQEGWKESDTPEFFERIGNDRWYLNWEPKFNWISIGDNESQNGYSGPCKSINEFRKIIKWISI